MAKSSKLLALGNPQIAEGDGDASRQAPMDTVAAELAIRARRAAFNRAIAERDAAAIAAILARDCVMITGSDSAVISGRLAQVKVWRREFAARREPYVRIPGTIALSAVEPIAMEHGTWSAIDPAGASTTSGTYAAKWRLSAGEWAIEAEVFVTLTTTLAPGPGL